MSCDVFHRKQNERDWGCKVSELGSLGGHSMESHDSLVTADVKIEIDVAEEDGSSITHEWETAVGMEAPPCEADGHHGNRNCQTTDEDTDQTAGVESDSVRYAQVKFELGVELDGLLEPESIPDSQVNPFVHATTGTVNSAGGCMSDGVKPEPDTSTRSWSFQHPQVKLEPEIEVRLCVQREPSTCCESETSTCTSGCTHKGVKLEPDINQKVPSWIKTERLHSEHGLCHVDCVHNSDMNVNQCQPEVKPDTVILCDTDMENHNAAYSNAHSFESRSVSSPLNECEKPAADLSVSAHSDLMTAAHSGLITAHSGLMTAAHYDLMTAAHSVLMTAAQSDLMTAAHSGLMTAPHDNLTTDAHRNLMTAVKLKAHTLKTLGLTHTDQKSHVCTACNASFPDTVSLKRHMLSHTGQKTHMCTQCDASFTHASDLKRHMLTHVGQKPHICTECGAGFTAANKLKRHVLTHTDQKPHKCTECGASFIEARRLKTHLIHHTGLKPHKCTECGASFIEAKSLRAHMFMHSGQKPHKCTTCDARFANTSRLKSHMQIHTGQKPHKCTECNASFTWAGGLKRHMFIHTGHKCTSCDVSFISASMLKIHMQIHTGQKPQ